MLLHVFQNRSYLSGNFGSVWANKISDESHEPIPYPENNKPVAVYFGKNTKILSVEALGKRQNGEIGSHASPREHYRKGTDVRETEYVMKNGTHVKRKAHKRKGGVVNEGQTKCTYEMRKRR